MRPHLIPPVVLLATLGAAYWYVASKDAESARLAEEGRTVLVAGNKERAITLFDAALEKGPRKFRRAQINAWLGRAKFAVGQTDEAIANFNTAVQLDPGLTDAYTARAKAYNRKGNQEQALRDLDEAIRHGSRDPETYLDRATILLQRGEAEKSLRDFTEAGRRGADQLKILIMSARAQVALNNLDAAIENLGRALQIDPQNQEARALRGDLYYKKNDVGKAMADYAELRTEHGESWASKSKQDFAAAAAQNSAAQNYAATTSIFAKANAALDNGRLDEAIALYTTLLVMDLPLPFVSTISQNRGNAYGRKGEDEKALRDYEQAIRFNPANAGAYVNRGLIYANRGDHDAAVQDYNEALRFDPKMYQALYNRGLSRRDDGDLESAERDLTEVIRLNSKFAPAYVNRAMINLRKGRLDRALSDYASVAKIDPTIGEIYAGRALVYLKKRAYARADANLEKATQLKTRNLPGTLNSLAWLRATCPEKSVRNGKKAVEAALQVCELTYWSDGSYLDTLAAAYAENGQFENAVKFQELALSLSGISRENRGEAERRLLLYQQRRAYRDHSSE